MVRALPHLQLLHFPALNDTFLLFRPGFKDHIAQLAGAEVVGEFEHSALLKTFGASGTMCSWLRRPFILSGSHQPPRPKRLARYRATALAGVPVVRGWDLLQQANANEAVNRRGKQKWVLLTSCDEPSARA